MLCSMYIQEPLEEKRETLVMKLRRIQESVYEVAEFSLTKSNRETVFIENNTSVSYATINWHHVLVIIINTTWQRTIVYEGYWID